MLIYVTTTSVVLFITAPELDYYNYVLLVSPERYMITYPQENRRKFRCPFFIPTKSYDIDVSSVESLLLGLTIIHEIIDMPTNALEESLDESPGPRSYQGARHAWLVQRLGILPWLLIRIH
jgi:hypothetical protein